MIPRSQLSSTLSTSESGWEDKMSTFKTVSMKVQQQFLFFINIATVITPQKLNSWRPIERSGGVHYFKLYFWKICKMYNGLHDANWDDRMTIIAIGMKWNRFTSIVVKSVNFSHPHPHPHYIYPNKCSALANEMGEFEWTIVNFSNYVHMWTYTVHSTQYTAIIHRCV